jgi:hypothetical protein
MIKFFIVAFSPSMLPYTLALFVVVIYWCISMLGLIDLDILDFDWLPGLDEPTVIDSHGSSLDGAVEGQFGGLPRVIGLGTVPVTIILSFLLLFMWLIAFLLHYYLGDDLKAQLDSWLLRWLVVFCGAFLIGLVLTAIATRPFHGIFAHATDHAAQHLIGQRCTVTSSTVTATFGTAEVKMHGPPLLLNIVCPETNHLHSGAAAEITGYDPDRHLYTVKPC